MNNSLLRKFYVLTFQHKFDVIITFTISKTTNITTKNSTNNFVANRIIINCNVVYVHYYYLSLAKLNTKNPNLVLHVLC